MQTCVTIKKSTGAEKLNEIQELRYKVLREPLGLPYASAVFHGDDFEASIHLLAIQMDRLIGCASLLPDNTEPRIQLRGMAVRHEFQRCGIGRQLVDLAKAIAVEQDRLLWCNAREAAISFYAKQGWVTTSDYFEVPTIGKHVVMEWQPTCRNLELIA